MEVTGVVFGQSLCFTDSVKVGCLKQGSMRLFCGTRVPVIGGFSDKSHMEYYCKGARMEVVKVKEDKKEIKKKTKLLKGLSKNLNMFSDMGFGLNVDSGGLDHQVKGQMISEATEVLVAQLQKLEAEKMEAKRIKKEEKAKKKAAKMMTECKDSSSSGSSSSESDCDKDNVMNMRKLKTVKTSNTCEETTSSLAVETAVTAQIFEKVEDKLIEHPMLKDLSIIDEGCKKIEVCMGGKCKKSGAAMLMENFQKAVGGEAAVVGCKCMGKCKDGPNVRVRSEDNAMLNPLCIGVGPEDVDAIVTNFFGGGQGSCSDMVSALSSV